jgi:hypothetical protein
MGCGISRPVARPRQSLDGAGSGTNGNVGAEDKQPSRSRSAFAPGCLPGFAKGAGEAGPPSPRGRAAVSASSAPSSPSPIPRADDPPAPAPPPPGPLLRGNQDRLKAINGRSAGSKSVVGKESPYYPQKLLDNVNRNGAVQVAVERGMWVKAEPVWCRHLAMAYFNHEGPKHKFLEELRKPSPEAASWAFDTSSSTLGELFDIDEVGGGRAQNCDENEAVDHIKPADSKPEYVGDSGIKKIFDSKLKEFDKEWKSWSDSTKPAHVRAFGSRDIGAYFYNIANAMVEQTSNAQAPRQANVLLLLSGEEAAHLLAAKVAIKSGAEEGEGGQQRVSITVYDPNETYTHARMSVKLSELRENVEGKSLGDFLSPKLFRDYQDGCDQIPISAFCKEVSLPDDVKIGRVSDKTLPSVGVLRAAMSSGDLGLLKDIKSLVKKEVDASGAVAGAYKSKLIKYLAEPDLRGRTLLTEADVRSSPEAIEAYFDIFKGLKLSESDQLTLAGVTISDNINRESFLANVFRFGSAAVIRGYAKCIDESDLPNAAKVKALTTFCGNNPAEVAFDKAEMNKASDEKLAAWIEGVSQAKNLDPRAMLKHLGEAIDPGDPSDSISPVAETRKIALQNRDIEARAERDRKGQASAHPGGSSDLVKAYEDMVKGLQAAHAKALNQRQDGAKSASAFRWLCMA